MAETLNREALVAALEAAVQEVFQMMMNLELRRGEVVTEGAPPARFDGVAALIGLAGEWAGTGALFCSTKSACRLAGSLLGTEPASVDDEILDAIGEVTNMVIGNFKVGIESSTGHLGMSIPTVVYGRNFTARALGANEWVVVPYAFEGGEVSLKICLERQARTAVNWCVGSIPAGAR